MKSNFYDIQTANAIHPDGSGQGWIAWWSSVAPTAEETAKMYPGNEGFVCPYGKTGDRLWVREKWASVWFNTDCETGYADDWGNVVPTPKTIEEAKRKNGWPITYSADSQERDGSSEERGFKWIPSIHMPRWASRIDLEITGVRVERLQDIGEVDAVAEGVDFNRNPSAVSLPGANIARKSFRSLWESINGPGSWEANQWVWVIEFKRVA